MRLVRIVIVTCIAGLVLALAAAPVGAQPVPVLVDVRAARHPGFDRVVFEFRGDLPPATVRYVDQLIQDGSGNVVSVAGAADLEVLFQGANAHDASGNPTVSPRRFSPGLPAVKEVAQVGDFEANVTYGIGVDRQRSFKVTRLSGPSRLVVDLSTTGDGGGAAPGGPTAPGGTGELPFTGSSSQRLLVTGLALLATGATAVALARRTRTP